MRRVYRTLDWSEAHLVAQMLGAHGVPAWVFDADFIRQDWFRSLAYGGYRVVVAADDDAATANRLMHDYATGGMALAGEEFEAQVCPHCRSGAVREDVRWRCAVFALLIVVPWLPSMIFQLAHSTPKQLWLVLLATMFLQGVLVPMTGLLWLRPRLRCDRCRRIWAPPRVAWRQLSQAANSADAAR